ncbi:hypothetical protein [Acinetobacter gerneri]|uniref:hypothetical protein n=1 Tax=Acinetobacter gerneri TaxID=202952 RepID=UPI003215BA96
MKKLNYILVVSLLASCSSGSHQNTINERQNSIQKSDEKNINNECMNNTECMPTKFLTPYYSISYDNLKVILPLTMVQFSEKLLQNNIVTSKNMKNSHVNDKDNPAFIDFENNSMLTLNPDPKNGYIKSIDYEYGNCLTLSVDDKSIISGLSKIFFKHENVEKILKFNIKQKNNNEMIINSDQLKSGVIFESVCDVASGKGQFNIYRK